ncbi:MAG: MBOAT family protein [Bdellovibrionaceae bacterium]|nr:MBOAT family protein [Pseudobdellovibrionaceae bacterium]
MNLYSWQFLFSFIAFLFYYNLLPANKKYIALFIGNILFLFSFGTFSFLFLLLVSSLSWTAAMVINRSKNYKWIQIMFIITLISILVFVKLFFKQGMSLLPNNSSMGLNIAGISFYSLKAISYIIDFRKHRFPINFSNIFNYLAFFPELLVGPIDRYKNLNSQIIQPDSINHSSIFQALYWIAWGLVKKFCIANNLAPFTEEIFNGSIQNAWLSLLALCLYSIQIYCDFSSYFNLSFGVSHLLGINIPLNFNNPLFSKTPIEFWRRWHITLGRWFVDYVFLPITIIKRWPIVFCIIFIFALSGLWHGFYVGFVLWGLFHAIGILVYSFVKDKLNKKQIKLPNYLNPILILLNFSFISLSWIFFVNRDISTILNFIRNILVSDQNFQFDLLSSQFIINAIISLFFLFILKKFSVMGNFILTKNNNLGIMLTKFILLVLILPFTGNFSDGHFVYLHI